MKLLCLIFLILFINNRVFLIFIGDLTYRISLETNGNRYKTSCAVLHTTIMGNSQCA